MSGRTHAVAAGIALATLAALGQAAHAEDAHPEMEVSVIHAVRTDGGTSIDPRLRDLPQLTREQPFLRYNVYKLLDRKRFPVETGKPATDPLVNGRTLELTLLDVIERGGKKRFHLRAAIDEPGKKPLIVEVTASENEPFFVAGESYGGGTLFLELSFL